ncbi:MAG: hypothetical protein RMJ86_10695 [Anaerolineae bacterium]|nr:hypothetical protein [Anaerolineae bacterium]
MAQRRRQREVTYAALARTPRNAALFNHIAEAEQWLMETPYCNAVLKWRTDLWGENPADFGRK